LTENNDIIPKKNYKKITNMRIYVNKNLTFSNLLSDIHCICKQIFNFWKFWTTNFTSWLKFPLQWPLPCQYCQLRCQPDQSASIWTRPPWSHLWSLWSNFERSKRQNPSKEKNIIDFSLKKFDNHKLLLLFLSANQLV